ncbi:MAG: hypothetical protein GPI96_15115 [Microcystis aeruginosa BS13-02]|nr:hypothetical protein [Microcystis aeruginosa BS13-02]
MPKFVVWGSYCEQVFGIYQAASESEVRELIEADPYWQNGIWTEYQVKEWIQAI